MFRKITIIVLLAFLISCETEDVNIDNNVFFDRELISELNKKSLDTLIIGSNPYVLDAYLWRDFMPFSPPDGRPIISINWLRNLDSTLIPNNIDLTKQYVIHGDSVWISDYEIESPPNQIEYKIEKVSRGGPKWGPHIYVDVVSNIHDSDTNEDYFITLKNVYVGRTD